MALRSTPPSPSGATAEQGRADFYALIATLLLAPPEARLLHELARAAPLATGHDALDASWQALCDAARAADPAAIADEHAALFDDADRRDAAAVPDDHVGAMCEVMRMLITGAPDVPRRTHAQQRVFFEAQLAGWYRAGLDDLRDAPEARFYRRVADFAEAWLDLEAQVLALARDDA